jgi:hypothetical protein
VEEVQDANDKPDSGTTVHPGDIEYSTDLAGVILSVTQDAWRHFAIENSAPAIADSSEMIGRSLESCLAGDAVLAQFRVLFGQVRSGQKDEITYTFWCDSHNQKRAMRLIMAPVRGETGAPVGVHFVSRLLEETQSAPNRILAASHLNLTATHKPLLTMCSYCKRIQWPTHSGNWMDIEAYGATDGPTDVRLSHGACADCTAAVLGDLAEKA